MAQPALKKRKSRSQPITPQLENTGRAFKKQDGSYHGAINLAGAIWDLIIIPQTSSTDNSTYWRGDGNLRDGTAELTVGLWSNPAKNENEKAPHFTGHIEFLDQDDRPINKMRLAMWWKNGKGSDPFMSLAAEEFRKKGDAADATNTADPEKEDASDEQSHSGDSEVPV